MFTKTNAERLVAFLAAQGVNLVFGIPGMHTLPLFEALRGARIRTVLATHEQGAGFMAGGYSRATGTPGVLVTVPGPGLTNVLTSLAECRADSCPLLVVGSTVSTDSGRRFQVHEIAQDAVATPFVKALFPVDTAAQLLPQLTAAWRTTTCGEPGPVLLSVPAQLWNGATQEDIPPIMPFTQYPPPGPDGFKTVLTALSQAEQVGLVVGQGVFGATDQLRALAEWLQAPVATTLSGRGALPEDHPLSLGMGWQPDGITFLNTIFSHCDLVLAIGLKFAETGTQSYQLRLPPALIHVDAAPANLGANCAPMATLAMDATTFLDQLLAHKAEFGPRPAKALSIQLTAQRMRGVNGNDNATQEIRYHIGAHSTDPATFFRALRATMAADAILVTDSGYHEILAARHYRVLAPRTLLTPADYQATGFGIPTAMGAALAQPRRQVFALVGDGSFVMSGLELLSAVREEVNLGVILINDGYYGILKQLQEERYGTTSSVALHNPDFWTLAAGCDVALQADRGDLAATLAAFVHGQGVRLLEVKATYATGDRLGMLARRWRRQVRGWVIG
ncbi:MAG TPA: thiamine pyrophosphate-binding protein [Caldilineaceae bacterium]|nr:thiamine pyrophosphate-binding protein [Caldilineaceae bacterium]